MSIIHVNAIKSKLKELFEGKIDMSDKVKAPERDMENHFLSRALAAYSVHHFAKVDPEVAAAAVTDGGDDNGIDAIYYDEQGKKLYMVQSKWIQSGNGEPDNGDVKKFIGGIKDLFNREFDVFNKKVRQKGGKIEAAIRDPRTKYNIVLAYTGTSLATPSTRDIDRLVTELNDTSEVAIKIIFNQKQIFQSLLESISGEPINLILELREWGKISDPYLAYYGQINGLHISQWWKKFGAKMVSRNLRGMLGDTEVNAEIKKTVEEEPENFWYFNNGITMVCKSIKKNMVGINDNAFGQFDCEDVSIINGAQTVGTLGEMSENLKENLGRVFVPIRIISAEGCPEGLEEKITRSNNTQNKIERRDFVAQDPEQIRMQNELALERVKYYILRSENVEINERAFDLVESTTALACASGKIPLVIQLKKEIGKLWDNLDKPPYKELFNPSVSGLYVWRCVQIQRKIDEAIADISKNKTGVELSIAENGNKFIAAQVFLNLDTKIFEKPDFKIEDVGGENRIKRLVTHYYKLLVQAIKENYPTGTLMVYLFRNVGKCEYLHSILGAAQEVAASGQKSRG